MKQSIILSPSLLSANFARLAESAREVIDAGAQWLHVDVMDNHYVPNLTFGPLVCDALRKEGITAPLDVHLMIEPVDALIPVFAKAGATMISFHPEASKHVDRTLQLIHECGCQAAVALNPSTPVSLLEPILDKLDMILLMSVNPGFSGQVFIPSVLTKIQQAKTLIASQSRPIRLQVDGGVTPDNIASIIAAGADTIVMGSAIFNTPSPAQTVQTLLSTLNQK